MRRIGIVLVIALGLVAPIGGASLANAGSVIFDFGAPQTLTTNAQQDAALARLRVFLNRDRAPADQFATIEALLRFVMVTALQSYGDQVRDIVRGDVCERFKALTPAQQASAIAPAPWNGQSPCP